MRQTVLITGASSGIGRATAALFHERGWNVAATMRSPDAAQGLAADDRLTTPQLDVLDPASIDSAVTATTDAFGGIDAVVNNAGYAVMGPLEATPPESAERQLAVNVLGPAAVIRTVLPHFRERRAGAIVNVSSIVGRAALPLGALYAASKFALEGLSEGLRFELAEIGVRVALVEPGLVATDFATRSLEFHADADPAAYGPILAAMGKASESLAAAAEPPDVVAEAIWCAVTDPAAPFRLPAGKTAEAALAERVGLDDEAHYSTLRARAGLGAPHTAGETP